MTINKRVVSAVGQILASAAALCMILSGLACGAFGSQRSCLAIQADASNVAPEGFFSDEEKCRVTKLAIEATDAGCNDLDSAERDILVATAEQACGE